MINYNDLVDAKSFEELSSLKPFDIKNGLNADRIKKYTIAEATSMAYNFAALPVDEKHIDALQALADEQQLIEKYKALLSGEIMNTGEKRLVLHQLTRGRALPGLKVMADGVEKGDFYQGELDKIKDFSDKVRSGQIKGSTGKEFKTVVQIGIGGSDLGPRALCYAMNLIGPQDGCDKKLEARFISNVDPDDACAVISGLDLESTLFILVSKSGTTQETLANRDLVFKVMENSKIAGLKPQKHLVAVTSNTSPLANNPEILASFFMDDYIGGRYSATSPVGGVILSLTYGFNVFRQLLDGAHAIDKAALEPDIRKNGIMMDAMIGIYLRNVLGYPYTAVLPYSQSLHRMPAHFQQLDMESNGKHVNRFGEQVSYQTGPVIFGEPGTNGQHSFYQLLHQGTDIVPMQFIGFKEKEGNLDAENGGSTSQTKLKANLVAQIVAFACGKDNEEEPNKSFDGGRPSSLLVAERLTPFTLGAILAHFENKVMFQGFVWNINSFDQEGFQLGKILAKKVLAGCEGDKNLEAYSQLLGI
ncbi:MAG: glucose-6-phosphate isomerase [Sphaerochaetaceae bacterium]|nr:glucose-6-phosphate isomerase [Sphaerochaetaceae bacterium]